MSMTREYRPIVKARYGPGGPSCRCCQPHLDKRGRRRVVRRKARLDTSMRAHGLRWDEDSELDLCEEVVWSEAVEANYGVRWRMTLHSFRLLPAWVRDGQEETYERERTVWALAGEAMCVRWGIPEADCDAIWELVQNLTTFSHVDEYGVFMCSHQEWD